MAKKESKSKQHTRDLVAGMVSSNSQSRTPVSSLYQKKTKVKAAASSGASRNKGTRQENKNNPNRMPEKFLLSVTNPGNRPLAPTAPNAPAKVAAASPLPILNSRNYKGYNDETRSFGRDSIGKENAALRASQEKQFSTQSAAYSRFQTQQSTYNTRLASWNASMATYNNTTLPNWTRANEQYTTNSNKNTKTTSKYNKDIKNFLSSLGGKNKGEVSLKTAAKTRGARNTNTRLGGARS